MSKREDPLKNSWAYQEIWQEGFQRGLQKVAQQQQLAALQRQRQVLECLVQKYFPNILEMAKERGNAIDRPDILQDIILQLFSAETEEEARRILSQ